MLKKLNDLPKLIQLISGRARIQFPSDLFLELILFFVYFWFLFVGLYDLLYKDF